MLEIPCVIFAGGKSSRMGEDKALLPFGAYDTLVEYQVAKFKQLFKDVYISCKSSDKFDFLQNKGITFIEDNELIETFAPTAGFIGIFEKLEADRIFAVSVDTPFISREQVIRLYLADQNSNDATIARTPEGQHPLCGIYHRSTYNHFVSMAKNDTHKLGKMLQTISTSYVDFEEEEPFFNLNHPHEYQQALKLV